MATPQTPTPPPSPPTGTSPQAPAGQPAAASQPAGWYQDPQRPGLRYWDGANWTQYTQPPAVAPPSAFGQIVEAYRAESRVKVAGIVARGAAIMLFLGLLGSAITWDAGRRGEESIFDLARSSSEVARPGGGYLVGPVLILILLPVLKRGRPAFRYLLKSGYTGRIVAASVLWIAGLATLIGGLASLDSGYEIRDGAYVAGTFMVIGLLATLFMAPAGLKVIRVDKGGNLQDEGEAQPPAATPPAATPPAAAPPPAA